MVRCVLVLHVSFARYRYTSPWVSTDSAASRVSVGSPWRQTGFRVGKQVSVWTNRFPCGQTGFRLDKQVSVSGCNVLEKSGVLKDFYACAGKKFLFMDARF